MTLLLLEVRDTRGARARRALAPRAGRAHTAFTAGRVEAAAIIVNTKKRGSDSDAAGTDLGKGLWRDGDEATKGIPD